MACSKEILSRFLEEGAEGLSRVEVAEILLEFRSLVKSLAWGALADAIEFQKEGSRAEFESPIWVDNLDPIKRVLRDEYYRGYVNGLVTARGLIDQWVADLERELAEREDDDTGRV